MKIFSILDPFFHALSDGKLIRLTVAWVLRILSGFAALTGLLGFITIIGFGIRATEGGMGNRSAGILLGCLLLSVLILAWGYISSGIFVFRAKSVEELGDSHFTVLSILSLLFRLNGELMFVLYTLLGVGGCLFVWFTDFSPFSMLGMLGAELPFATRSASGFLGGIELAVLFILVAFAGIVFSYALAELSVVLVEIALNTRGLRTAAAPVDTQVPAVAAVPALAPPAPPFAVAQPLIPAQRKCNKCGQPLDPGNTFCDECGTPVG